MDAVEMTLPANALVSKLVVPERDSKPSLVISEHGPVCESRKINEDVNAHKYTSLRCDENDRSVRLGEANKSILRLPNYDGKPPRRLSSLPCSIRPREDQQNDFVSAAGADNHGKRLKYDSGRCPSDEKTRIFKLKRGQDSKKAEKKLLRASIKTKHDALTSKTGFTTLDSISGGHNILGKYGINADPHDATKNVNELPLKELLDGSYKYSNLVAEKGKRPLTPNDNIPLSVEKACSVLLNGASDSNNNKRAPGSLSNLPLSLGTVSDNDEKDKGIGDSCSKVHDSVETNTTSMSLYQPGEILERLALPPSQDLEALGWNSSSNAVLSRSTMCMKAFHSANLPPFAWSFSHSGTCKPGLESARLVSNRNTGQAKWFRIGSCSTSTSDGQNCFFAEDSVDQEKVYKIVQDVKRLAEYTKPQLGGPHTISGSLVPDSSNNLVKGDSKEHVKLVDPSDKEYNTRNTEGFVGTSYSDMCKSSMCGAGPRYLQPTTLGTSNLDEAEDSTRLLAAASILIDISCSSNGTRIQNGTCSTIELQKTHPLPNSMKVCNSISSQEKPNRPFQALKHHEPVRQTDIITKHKLMSEKKIDSTHLNNFGREPVRWPSLTEGSTSKRKLEKVHSTPNNQRPHGITMRPSGSMPSPTRVEKVYDDQQKLRKVLKASTSALDMPYIKDWNRGRSKRL